MLALHGFDVYGLDVSARGVTLAREYAEAELARPQAYNFGSDWASTEKKGQAKGRGKVTFIEGDFFQSGWEARIKFDLIYDYTVSPSPSLSPFVLDCG
jgi:hypothetical protein